MSATICIIFLVYSIMPPKPVSSAFIVRFLTSIGYPNPPERMIQLVRRGMLPRPVHTPKPSNLKRLGFFNANKKTPKKKPQRNPIRTTPVVTRFLTRIGYPQPSKKMIQMVQCGMLPRPLKTVRKTDLKRLGFFTG